jgi:hypothetical protein
LFIMPPSYVCFNFQLLAKYRQSEPKLTFTASSHFEFSM